MTDGPEAEKESGPRRMMTHDPRYAEHAQREIHLFDGRMGA
ncbi:MAG: hypothetical protein OXF93_19700 [Acidobacteria bacterium]|nr:hypothetical protein [Acidobacteriota bacterium]